MSAFVEGAAFVEAAGAFVAVVDADGELVAGFAVAAVGGGACAVTELARTAAAITARTRMNMRSGERFTFVFLFQESFAAKSGENR